MYHFADFHFYVLQAAKQQLVYFYLKLQIRLTILYTSQLFSFCCLVKTCFSFFLFCCLRYALSFLIKEENFCLLHFLFNSKQHLLFKANKIHRDKIFFDIIAMTPRGTLGLCCVYIAQLITHTAIYTLPFTLQLCYKPLDVGQRVTKSQSVHTSSHDKLYTKSKNFYAFVRFLLNKSRRIVFIIRS